MPQSVPLGNLPCRHAEARFNIWLEPPSLEGTAYVNELMAEDDAKDPLLESY